MKIKTFARDSLFESRKEIEEYDAFISYSWKDKIFASKVAYLLEDLGYSVYIDLKDASLSRDKVTLKTVKRIATMMDKCKSLIYLHSPSATVSKWCPWELGYVSGRRNFKCVYLPLLEHSNQDFKNQEYLRIYPVGEYAENASTKKFDLWVVNQSNAKEYTTLKRWINGGKLIKHQ